MHGQCPGFVLLLNSEVDSMGGVVDWGAGLDAKSSPCHTAISKAQEELRLEYDVREERRRELEFLEKGGNPLDYIFGRAASISRQSTSLTDQLAEHEAKGSFALAASPHGDSVESSGRPGSSMGREPNIADNLLLFDGENSNPGGGKSIKRAGRRSNTGPLEQFSQIDSFCNTKESNDSEIFRLGPRGQAYARRNKSRSSRDSHSNNSLFLQSSCNDIRNCKESKVEVLAEEHAISSISNARPASLNVKNLPKSLSSKNQLDIKFDGGQVLMSSPNATHHIHSDTEKAVLHVAEINSPEKVNDIDHNTTPVKQAATTQSSGFLVKETTVSVGSLRVSPCAMDDNKVTYHDENNVCGALGVDFMHAHDDNMVDEENVTDTITEVVGIKNVIIDPSCVSLGHLHGNANDGESLSFRTAGSLDTKSKGHAACQNATCRGTFDDTCARENSQIAGDPAHITNNEARNSKTKLNNSTVQVEDEMQLFDKTDDQADKRPLSNIEIEKYKKSEISHDNSSFAVKVGIIVDNSIGNSHEPSSPILSKKVSSNAPEQNREANQLNLSKKMHEDAILKEARIIEANLKGAGVLTISCISSVKRQKCHWDFVLEEMAWMANDFMQERLWKTTAAAKVCHRIASICKSKFEQENLYKKQRNIARTFAKAVMKFWCFVDTIRTRGEASSCMNEDCDANFLKASNTSSFDTTKDQSVENCGRLFQPGIQRYALRLLQHISKMSNDPVPAEAPRTPDRINDAGTFGIFWDDLSDESLTYKVPPGAMHSYRESVEYQWAHFKKMGNDPQQEECEASVCDSFAGNAFEEDEGEIGVDIVPGAVEGKFSSKVTHKRKNLLKSCTTRHEIGTAFSYGPYLDGKPASHSLVIMGKRPLSTLHVGSVPTKRTRTAARQRLIIPFSVGVIGPLPVVSKTNVSSGDTSSFQDEQSFLHGASQPRKNSEVESTVDFESLLPFGNCDVPMKQKKKKPKHLGYINSLNLLDSRIPSVSGKASSYEQRLQADYMVQQDQRDHTKKRSESQQFESNGSTGFYGQNVVKKPKLSKLAESPELMTPAGGSMPSPVASQMSNMLNSNKLIRIINNRDRGRKSKALKIAAGQSGSGVSWSTFEDQALVVLVHDMGLNWELISDALNCTLHFKCIYRKPKDCKERHKFLMDKSACDGADSAEDSGSSQPYPSTLPGIPKGSARQLFQHLQGPMEEDTLKSHFEKIIIIGQHLYYFRSQDDNQELKQIVQAHGSHVFAVSQACPNNLPGTVLSPLDLCEAVNASPDVLGAGYQGSHTNGIVIPGQQGSLTPALSTDTNTMLEGSPSVVLGNSLPSLPLPVNNTPPRDAQRHGVPRSTTLPVDDQQRIQQYSQMFSSRKPQSSISIPGALPAGVDRGVRMLPGGNSMGMVCGVSRSMSMPRAGFQAISPSGMFNMVSPNKMLSSNGVAMPNVTAHSTSVSGTGNTMLRPHDALQMLRPSQITEEHRHTMMQEIQLQVSLGNAQATTPFTGVSSSFSNAPVPPVQHQSHQIPQQPVLGNPNHNIQGTSHSSTQQQAYIRFAKERQLQQRIVPQAQQYSGSSTLLPMQNNSHFQQQSQSSSPVNSIVSPQPQHKQQPMPHNPQTSNTMSSQILKQRQRQQIPQQQQQLRNLPQQKQQLQRQPKLVKDLGRGTMLLHQNRPVDASQVGGLPTAPKNQASEKHLMQKNQRFILGGTGLNSNLQQPLNQQKLYSHHPQQSKQVPVMSSHPDNNQASMQALSSDAVLSTQQSDASTLLATQQQQRQANQSTTNMQRIMLQQNLQLNPDGRRQSTNEPVHANQMIPSTSLPQTSDSSSMPVVSSGVQWKPEPTFETCTLVEKSQLAALPWENFTGNDAVIPPSSQGLIQRQLSGNISIHGHGVGGQWQQKQQQLLQPQLPPQKHGVQGNLYAQPSNTRPG